MMLYYEKTVCKVLLLLLLHVCYIVLIASIHYIDTQVMVLLLVVSDAMVTFCLIFLSSSNGNYFIFHTFYMALDGIKYKAHLYICTSQTERKHILR